MSKDLVRKFVRIDKNAKLYRVDFTFTKDRNQQSLSNYVMADSYPNAIKMLEEYFGDPITMKNCTQVRAIQRKGGR
jgi:hypothetical protein